MKKFISAGIAGLFLLSAMIFTGCSSTRLVSSWKSPDAGIQRDQKILVIGLMGSKDRQLRESIENTMVASLKAHGINAGSAYAEYGPKSFDELSEQEALQKIRNKGYDGSFTIALLDRRKERNYTPGTVYFFPQPYRFWGYYRSMYARIYEPGYYTVSTNFMLEGSLYNLSTDKLIYSAQTRTSAPDSPQALADEFNNTLIKDLVKKKLINP